jgi:hypothetical protein
MEEAVRSCGSIVIVIVILDDAELGVCGGREWELRPPGAGPERLRVEGQRFRSRLANAPVVVESEGRRVWAHDGFIARLVGWLVRRLIRRHVTESDALLRLRSTVAAFQTAIEGADR